MGSQTEPRRPLLEPVAGASLLAAAGRPFFGGTSTFRGPLLGAGSSSSRRASAFSRAAGLARAAPAVRTAASASTARACFSSTGPGPVLRTRRRFRASLWPHAPRQSSARPTRSCRDDARNGALLRRRAHPAGREAHTTRDSSPVPARCRTTTRHSRRSGPDGDPLRLTDRRFATLLRDRSAASTKSRRAVAFSPTPAAPRSCSIATSSAIGRKSVRSGAPLEWRAILFQEPITTHTPGVQRSASRGHRRHDRARVPRHLGVAGHERSGIRIAARVHHGNAQPRRPPRRNAGCRVGGLAGHASHASLTRSPPPRDLRVGIERIYMFPLRAALDRAPARSRKDPLVLGAAAR